MWFERRRRERPGIFRRAAAGAWHVPAGFALLARAPRLWPLALLPAFLAVFCIVAGFFLVVTASGLWFREKLVWLTTLLSMIGYASLAIVGGNDPRAGDSPYHHVILATALAVCGLTVSYQIRRVRALSQYYESRPLP